MSKICGGRMKKEIITQKEWINLHFSSPSTLYFTNKIQKQNYMIFYSDIIEDSYWNIAYLNNLHADFGDTWKKIELEMKHLNRRPAVYITSNQENLELEKSIRESHLENLYTDVWMVLQNRKKLSRQTSGIQENVQIQEVGEILKEKYIQAIMEGFSGDDPNDPYESLSPSYRVALERSFSSKKKVAPKVIHFLARIGEEPVATATVIYSGTKAILYNITTKKAYQRKGICKKMMNWIVEYLWNRGITNIALQTEEGFYTQTVYQNLGFEEILLGKAYAKRQS